MSFDHYIDLRVSGVMIHVIVLSGRGELRAISQKIS